MASSTHPEQGLVPVKVLQKCPEAEAPQRATVSNAKSPGFTVFRSKRVCAGTWDGNEGIRAKHPALRHRPQRPGWVAGRFLVKIRKKQKKALAFFF
jgi:hypothetical protein